MINPIQKLRKHLAARRLAQRQALSGAMQVRYDRNKRRVAVCLYSKAWFGRIRYHAAEVHLEAFLAEIPTKVLATIVEKKRRKERGAKVKLEGAS